MIRQTIKPETIQRLVTQRFNERKQRHEDLLNRLLVAAKIHGPDSIYAEMYIEISNESI